MKFPLIWLLPVCSTLSLTEARELSTDRPDATESPYTVEPGLFQVETTLFGYSKDAGTSTWAFAETNFKTGLGRDTDLQLVVRPWIHEEAGAEGFGDVDMRLKWNLWGNDSDGGSAGALMPFVTIPTHTAVSGNEWEGGLIFPVSMELTEGVGFGFQTEIDRVWDDAKSGYDWDFVHTAVVGVDLTDALSFFIEYVGIAGDGPYQATANAGFTFAVGENMQWDIAAGVGLNDAAEDLSLIQGVSFRF